LQFGAALSSLAFSTTPRAPREGEGQLFRGRVVTYYGDRRRAFSPTTSDPRFNRETFLIASVGGKLLLLYTDRGDEEGM